MNNLERLKKEVFTKLPTKLQRDLHRDLDNTQAAIWRSNERQGILDEDEIQREVERAQISLLKEYNDLDPEDIKDLIEPEPQPQRRGRQRVSTTPTPESKVVPLRRRPFRKKIEDKSQIQATKSKDTGKKSKGKKSNVRTKKLINTKAKKDLENVECNVLTNNCQKCDEVKTCKKMKGGFTMVSNALSFNLLPIMSGNAVKLYLYFSAMAGGNPKDGNYGKCWPSNAKIEEDTGINHRNTWAYLAELEAMNLIKMFYKRDGTKIKQRFVYVTYFANIQAIKKLRNQ